MRLNCHLYFIYLYKSKSVNLNEETKFSPMNTLYLSLSLALSRSCTRASMPAPSAWWRLSSSRSASFSSCSASKWHVRASHSSNWRTDESDLDEY